MYNTKRFKKTSKKGGTLRKNNIVKILKKSNVPLDTYYPYLEIMKSIMKQGYYFEVDSKNGLPKTEICIKGDAVDAEVEYVGRGKDTLSLRFNCNKDISVVLKAYINMDFSTNKETYDDYRLKMSDIHGFGPYSEFIKISQFNSPHIIKAFKYFF